MKHLWRIPWVVIAAGCVLTDQYSLASCVIGMAVWIEVLIGKDKE